jgi:hypothetical protein
MRNDKLLSERQYRTLTFIKWLIITTGIIGLTLSYLSETLRPYAAGGMMLSGLICMIAALVICAVD